MQLNSFIDFFNTFNIIENGIKLNSILAFISIVLGFILYIFELKNEPEQTTNEKVTITPTNIIGGIIMGGIIAILMWYVLKFINLRFFYIPMYLLMIYVLVIIPIKNGQIGILKNSAYTVSAYLVVILNCVFEYHSITINWLYTNFNIDIFQSLFIIYFFIVFYLSLYCLFLNIYYINRALIICFKKPYKLLNRYFKYIDSKFDYSNLTLKFEKYKKYKTKKNLISKIFVYINYFILEIITNTVYYLLSIIYSFIIFPIIKIIYIIFKLFININDIKLEKTVYFSTKIILIISFIVEYILIQINPIFSDIIINVYEYISTAIMIPVILESLQLLNKNL